MLQQTFYCLSQLIIFSYLTWAAVCCAKKRQVNPSSQRNFLTLLLLQSLRFLERSSSLIEVTCIENEFPAGKKRTGASRGANTDQNVTIPALDPGDLISRDVSCFQF
jgi:hypothetical protein